MEALFSRRRWRSVAAGLALALGMLASTVTTVASAHERTQAIELYVSPWGHDHWPGTAARPFATLDRAQRTVRARTAGMSSDIVVNLRAGTYALRAPLQLSSTAGDSGEHGHSVIYQAYGYGTSRQERVVISGGRRISGWRPADRSGSIWTAAVGDLETRQLYVDGRRAPRATLQNGIPGTITRTPTGYVTDSAVPQSWRNPEDIELVYTRALPWSEPRCGVAAISGDATSTTITMDQPCFRWATNLYGPQIAPLSIENSPSFLTPGTFYLDRSRPGRHVLLYAPRPGEDLRRAEVVAPVLEALVVGEGTASTPLHDVAFKGLSFQHATWLAPNTPNGFVQFFASFYENGDAPPGVFSFSDQARHVPGNVAFRTARGIVLERNRFEHLGAVGLELSHDSSANVVRGNVFTDISQGGIIGGGLHPYTVGVNSGNVIENNWIHHIGVEYRGGAGVFLLHTQDSVIAHNQVNDVPFIGISAQALIGDTTTRGTRMLHNHVFRAAQVLHDAGGVFVSGAQGTSYETGAVLRGNVVHDMVGDPTLGTFMGIFTDYGSRWVTVDSNIVYRTLAVIGGCSSPTISDVTATGNFFDADKQDWACGPRERVTVADNTLLGEDDPEGACRAISACAAILQSAGLEREYRDLLRR